MPRSPSPAPAATVGWDRVLALRLERQHLATRAPADRLVEIVGEMVGIHAQVMSSAELQLAARMDGLRPDDVRDALWTRRELVKAWSFRGTLHLLTVDDLVEFVDAAATRERWTEDVWLRFFGTTAERMEALIDAVAATLSAVPMTRGDLADAVAARLGDPELASTLRSGWGTYLGPAAQRGHLVFGPSEGRNVTFVRPSDWLGRSVARSERQPLPDPLDAFAGLIARFLAVFPGSSRDMIGRWWGAQRAGLVNAALERLPVEVVPIDVDGVPALVRKADAAALVAAEPFRGVRLLPGFDPFTNELPRRVDTILPVVHHDRVYRTAGWVTPLVVLDGRVGGTWEITGSARRGAVEVVPWGSWRSDARRELADEVDRVAAFLGRPLALEVGAALPV